MPAKKKDKGNEKLLRKIRQRFKVMSEADESNRRKAIEDLEFLHIPGRQWDDETRRERGEKRCFEFNKTRITAKRIINDMRANRPQGKVRAVEDNDKDTAEVMEGICRNVWTVSDADTVIDNAAEYQVGAGMGAWRVETKYLNEASFTQDICISPIKNPFCLYADPTASDPLKRDASDWILTERISKASYEASYPGRAVVDWGDDIEFDDEEDWADEDDATVRICEYWWKEPATKTIYQTKDGRVIDAEDARLIDPQLIVREREVQCHKIMMCIASGESILKGPVEWAGRHFPFVLVYGEWVVIKGKIHWHGITRFAKDAQRAYNLSRTSEIETVSQTSQSKYWATPEQAKGHVDQWADAHKKNYPFQLYNPDPKAPGPPVKMPGADVPVALVQQSQLASEDIKAVTGIYDASLGAQGNETSGRAINARQRQGEIATFNYLDNISKGIKRTLEIVIDLIQEIYDTERSVRILGVDGAEKYAKVNQVVQDPATGMAKTINDLSRGQFDVTVTVGPSFATQRMEASETYTNLAGQFPQILGVAGDLIVKAMDLPYSEQIAERLKAMLPPQVQQQLGDGKPLPPEAQAAMMQASQAMEMVAQKEQLVQQAAQEVQQGQAENEKGKAEVQQLLSEVEIKRAQFDAHVAKQLAQITLKEAQSSAGEAQQGAQQDRDALSNEIQQAVVGIQQLAAQFMQQASQTLAEIMAKQQTQVVVANPPREKIVEVERVNGKLRGRIVEVAQEVA